MRHPLIVKDYPHFLHGGDYNPDQWLDRPDIIDDDFRLAREAGVNSFSIGIFAWAALEPEEGKFTFDWLDRIMDRMAAQDMKAVLATPSGAKPNWMAQKYPEIRRVNAQGQRDAQGARHNHCFTSPVYREKVSIMNTKLAERYRNHPALGVWHLSNEYSGECHCEYCLAAFRVWLQRKYGTLDKLNAAWWSAFWAHTVTDWSQIIAIDGSVHGLYLDWMRFVSDQTADFIRHEAAPLRQLTPEVPITTNLMGFFPGLDYWRIARELDLASWDNYPAYHERADNGRMASKIALLHDMNRCFKGGKPFMLMESSPSAVNWMQVNKLLRPGMHRLKSLQAVAHGADTVQYFQYRKSRGSSEKFHGAVVDHVCHGNTRVFREIAGLGRELETLAPVLGCATPARAAVIYDWENRWILDAAQGPRRDLYEAWVCEMHRPLWQNGVPTDVINMDCPFDGYDLIIAPALYILRPGVAERLRAFVARGGTLVGTFLTGIADENDLVFLGGWPGELRDVFGIWAEEIDYLYDDESNRVVPQSAALPGFAPEYRCGFACDLIHAEGARTLATYGDDFYAGRPALTVNDFGKGKAYYLATRADGAFLQDFTSRLIDEAGLKRVLRAPLPEGVTAQVRGDGKEEFVFLMNFSLHEQFLDLTGEGLADLHTGKPVEGIARLEKDGALILRRAARMQ